MSYIQVTKPHTTIPVKYKLDCKESVKRYLTEHGWKFKNKNERNGLVVKFLATHDMPIHLKNENYNGDINHHVLNCYEATRNWSLFKRWLYSEMKARKNMRIVATLTDKVNKQPTT